MRKLLSKKELKIHHSIRIKKEIGDDIKRDYRTIQKWIDKMAVEYENIKKGAKNE